MRHLGAPASLPARSTTLAYCNLLQQILSMLPDEQPNAEQIAALRRMSGQERWRLAERLYWSARKMKAAGIRAQHPDWSEEQVNDEVRRIFLNART